MRPTRSSPSSSTPRAACSSPMPATGTRFDAARRTAGAVSRTLESTFAVETLALGDTLSPFGDRTSPDGRRSDLAAAIAAVRDRHAGRPLAAVVLVSDGVDTSGSRVAGCAPAAGVHARDRRRRGAARSRGAGGRRRRRGADRFRRRAVGDDRRARLPRRAGRGARRRERPRGARAPRQPAGRRHRADGALPRLAEPRRPQRLRRRDRLGAGRADHRQQPAVGAGAAAGTGPAGAARRRRARLRAQLHQARVAAGSRPRGRRAGAQGARRQGPRDLLRPGAARPRRPARQRLPVDARGAVPLRRDRARQRRRRPARRRGDRAGPRLRRRARRRPADARLADAVAGRALRDAARGADAGGGDRSARTLGAVGRVVARRRRRRPDARRRCTIR